MDNNFMCNFFLSNLYLIKIYGYESTLLIIMKNSTYNYDVNCCSLDEQYLVFLNSFGKLNKLI